MMTSFETWMAKLDRLFAVKFGLHSSDFPDYNWYDEYHAGCTPEESFVEWCLLTDDGVNA